MATCPRCMGALTDSHRCPPRSRFGPITNLLTNLAVGGAVGGLFVYAIEDRPGGPLVIASAALGAVLTGAVRQAIRGQKF